MATVTFDTLKFVKSLESAGVPAGQAEAISVAVRDAHATADVATKGDIALVRKDIELLRWMMGLVIGGIIALVLKTFS